MTTYYAWASGDDRDSAIEFRTSCHRSAAELWAESAAENTDELVIERIFVSVLKEGETDALEFVVRGHVRVTYSAKEALRG